MILCNRFLLLSCSLLFATLILSAQTPPKREFRGAWVASVTNIDWPSSAGLSSQTQRTQLTALLDQLAAAGINAVVLQIRPACDAFYASPYEPWSSWLTGTQGTPPSNDYYDPLEFAAQEAHKRGMEIHAWFNPYRVKLSASSPQLASNNVAVVHPDWAITCPDGYTLLDPGLQLVRDHVARVIADVVRRYDIDGVHMDDYFYPYSEHNFAKLDTATFRKNSRGFAFPDSLAPWRRDNVNLLIKQVYDSVQAIKPVVKVGMSPFGIWKSGVPPGIFGTSGYNDLYCDAVAWMTGKYIDYITPQLYWPFGGGQDYALLQPWWASQTNGRHLYTGNTASVGSAQVGRQINFNRATKAQGSVIFSAKSITGGLRDSLKFKYFATAAVIPVISWKDTVKPNAPTNMRASINPTSGMYELAWDAPPAASDGDSARRYLIYRFNKQTYQPADLDASTNLLALAGLPTVVPAARIDSVNLQYYFAVSALDRNNNESALSNVIPISSPVATPILAFPLNLEQNFAQAGYLSWRRDVSSLQYRVQVATSADFATTSVVATFNIADTSTQVGGLLAQTTYYWRVVAGNQGATGVYSNARSFKTGWPLPPTLVYPVIANGITRTPTFVWNKGTGTSFHIRITDAGTLVNVIDVALNDTTFLCTRILDANRIYTWAVSSVNAYGASDWSAEGRFKTSSDITVVDGEGTVPSEFSLSQNYPNPFNPATKIRFAVPRSGLVSLRVYDVLGREVAVLVDNELKPGFYTAQFDARILSSGVYFYRLVGSGFVESKKMQLVK